MEITDYKKRILVTGGAGFIGSNLCRYFVHKYPQYLIVNYDALTYAGNPENFSDLLKWPNYRFVYGDISKTKDFSVKKRGRLMKEMGLCLETVFERYSITDVIHLAAESHVDRSIVNPTEFVNTNVVGTINILNVCKSNWGNDQSHRFHHVSTDEVYGALDMNPLNKFTEKTPYAPHSPYSASKASSDMFVRAYHDTYGMNVTISNCSNNYGPYQFPEKLIPLVIQRIKNGEEIPVYGQGKNVRDWLYVEDHVRAIDTIFHDGVSGETYNVGGGNEKSNIYIIKTIIKEIAKREHKLNMIDDIDKRIEEITSTIKFVSDRAGHDLRYAIDASKIENELGWKPMESFESGMAKTISWYMENNEWLEHCISGSYKDWIKYNYTNRK